MSMIPNNTVIVIADGREARFLRNAGDEQRLELVQDKMVDGTDHETGPAGVQPPENDPMESGFANKVAHRINAAVLKNQIDHLVIAADPTTLGEIRKLLHKESAAKLIGDIAKDWTNTPLPDIAAGLANLKMAAD